MATLVTEEALLAARGPAVRVFDPTDGEAQHYHFNVTATSRTAFWLAAVGPKPDVRIAQLQHHYPYNARELAAVFAPYKNYRCEVREHVNAAPWEDSDSE